MKDGETPEEVNRRLKVLMVDMKDCGFKDCDDDWFKEKFLQTLVPHNDNMVMNMQEMADYLDLSPNDVFSIFVQMNILKKSSEDTIAHVNGTKRASLALKAISH